MPKLLAPTLALFKPYVVMYYMNFYSRTIGHINLVIWTVSLTSCFLRNLAYLILLLVHYIGHISPIILAFINPVFCIVGLMLWFLCT